MLCAIGYYDEGIENEMETILASIVLAGGKLVNCAVRDITVILVECTDLEVFVTEHRMIDPIKKKRYIDFGLYKSANQQGSDSIGVLMDKGFHLN